MKTVFDNIAESMIPRVIDLANLTDLGNAKRFVTLHQRNIKYVPVWKCWMVWDGKRWIGRDSSGMVPLVDEMIKSMYAEANGTISSEDSERLKKHAKATEAENRIMATIRLAASQPDMQADPDDFDRDKYLINFANGTIDLKQKQLREFQREDMMTKICSVVYESSTKAPRWISFLNEIFENKSEMINYIQTILGMCMTGDASQEQIFIFWGATGGNGKGTLVEAVAHILSEYHVPLPIESILSKNKTNIPNDIAMLKGARLCVINEPEFGVRISESKIKQLTSKDSISARFLGKEFFRFKPTHHTIIQTNPKPNIRLDGGIERRLVLVPFNFKVDKPDLTLDVKLRAESSGILNWLLDGCERWQKEGLVKPQEVIEAIEDYKAEMEPLQDFFDNYTIKDSTAITPHIILFTIYKLWCEINEIIPKGAKGFTQLILSKGFKSKLAYDRNGIRCRAYYGICGTLGATEAVIQYTQSGATKEWVLEHLTLGTLGKVVGAHSSPIHACSTYVPCVPSVLNDASDAYNTCIIPFNEVFQSVPSVLYYQDKIINKIKERYDIQNKRDTISELANMKDNMLSLIHSDFVYDNVDDEHIMKIINEYCHARGWE